MTSRRDYNPEIQNARTTSSARLPNHSYWLGLALSRKELRASMLQDNSTGYLSMRSGFRCCLQAFDPASRLWFRCS